MRRNWPATCPASRTETEGHPLAQCRLTATPEAGPGSARSRTPALRSPQRQADPQLRGSIVLRWQVSGYVTVGLVTVAASSPLPAAVVSAGDLAGRATRVRQRSRAAVAHQKATFRCRRRLSGQVAAGDALSTGRKYRLGMALAEMVLLPRRMLAVRAASAPGPKRRGVRCGYASGVVQRRMDREGRKVARQRGWW